MTGPVVAVTMGDPAGVGPEICVLAMSHSTVYDRVRSVIVGDVRRLEMARSILIKAGRLQEHVPVFVAIKKMDEAKFAPGTVDVLDLQNVPEGLEWGHTSSEAGRASFEYVERSVQLAVDRQVEAICTAPINKEAWKLANITYPGHTEALAFLSGSTHYAMMLVNGALRVVHVTTHVSMRDAVFQVTTKQVYDTIQLTASTLRQLGMGDPRIAVAGLNPHAGEGGLFGEEDRREIAPAVEQARQAGINATGPWPPDSVFFRAANGEFDCVVAQYHDQGHIPIKMLGFDTGINVTIGLPILRTSVDHGTAFDIAGKGVVREHSMIECIKVAADLSN